MILPSNQVFILDTNFNDFIIFHNIILSAYGRSYLLYPNNQWFFFASVTGMMGVWLVVTFSRVMQVIGIFEVPSSPTCLPNLVANVSHLDRIQRFLHSNSLAVITFIEELIIPFEILTCQLGVHRDFFFSSFNAACEGIPSRYANVRTMNRKAGWRFWS